jgi:hypothetical protein
MLAMGRLVVTDCGVSGYGGLGMHVLVCHMLVGCDVVVRVVRGLGWCALLVWTVVEANWFTEVTSPGIFLVIFA